MENHESANTKQVSFVETFSRQCEKVLIVERWIPARDGDHPQALFGNWEEGFTSMTLEGRYIDGKKI